MTDNNKYLHDLDEYIRQGEPEAKERSKAWQTAIGLQKVDGLETSDYLLDTARKNIEGDISIAEAKQLIDSYYHSRSNRMEVESDRTEEADKVSTRITELLSEKSFTLSPTQLISIHRRLFEGIYKFAGRIRDYNITKNEWVLRGKTVFYADYDTITDTLNYDISTEKSYSYKDVQVEDAIRHLAHFCSNLWQIHAFGEGNTRTTAVFMIKYLRTLGFNVANDVFAAHSWYFRNALVRANYRNVVENIDYDDSFLERFFRNMLLGENNALRNREMHLDWGKQREEQAPKVQVQSADLPLSLPPKCKSCTLEEVAVLRVIQSNPTATQKMIAQEIGKSERTVKNLTVRLSEKGIIERRNGKRNGYWAIIGT